MSATKTTIAAVLVVAITFGAGIAVGVFVDRALMVRQGRPDHVPPFASNMMAQRLARHLDLTPAQRRQVEQILERRHARMNKLWSSVQPDVRREIESTNEEIERVLTPQQRAEFEKLKMRMHGPGPRGRRPMHRGGPPPPP